MKRALATAVVAVLGLVASGCGDDGESGSTTTASTAPTAVTTTSPATAPTTVAVTTTAAGAAAAKPTVADVALKGGSEAPRYTYEVTYPEVAGLADSAVQTAVNDRTRADVTAAVDEFVDGTDELAQADQPSGLTGTYDLARLDDGLLSFRLKLSRYFAPQAHPAAVRSRSTTTWARAAGWSWPTSSPRARRTSTGCRSCPASSWRRSPASTSSPSW